MMPSEKDQVRRMAKDMINVISGAPSPLVIAALGEVTCRVFDRCADPHAAFNQFSIAVHNALTAGPVPIEPREG